MIFLISAVAVVVLIFIIVLARQYGKKTGVEQQKSGTGTALGEPDTRSTDKQAETLKETRGSTSHKPEEIKKQLESGVAPADQPPPAGFSASKVITDMLKDPVLYGTIGGELVLSKIKDKVAKKITEQSGKLSKNVVNKAAREGGERAIQKMGMKIISEGGERAAIKAATAGAKAGAKAGTSLATKAATAASTGPGAPFVLAAEMAFGIFTNAMDGLNLGGFNNLSTMSMLNEMRDSTNQYFTKELGSKIPLVYGPMDTLSQDVFTELLTKEILELISKDPNKPKGEIPDSYLNAKNDEAIKKICLNKGGVVYTHPNTKETMCSFTKDKCVAPWPLQSGDTYYEFKDNVCQIRPSIMKEKCQGMGLGVTYNTDTGSCNLTKEYCGRYAGSASLKNGDCNINKGQDIAESIFGKTLTRSIVNIFDFQNNYEKCPSGTNEPDEIMWMAGGSGLLASRYLCSGSKCKDDEEMMMELQAVGKKTAGMCYPKCKPGYVSYWGKNRASSEVAGMCYKECPAGTDPTAAVCTRLHENKSDAGRTADCPSNMTRTSAGLCQPKCTDPGFSKSFGGLCYHDSVDTNLLVKGPSYGSCPDGFRTEPATCFKDAKCRTDPCGKRAPLIKTCLSTTSCSGPESRSRPKSCPTGYTERAGMCYAESRPIQVAKSTIEVGQCRADEDKVNGMCYPKCSKYGGSFTRLTGTGTCQMTSLSITRDSYTRPPRVAYTVFPKKRTTPFPSTSESDFKNSTIGKYIQAGINSARDGDPKGFGKAMAGMAMVANPAVLSLGMQDLADMGYQEGTKAAGI